MTADREEWLTFVSKLRATLAAANTEEARRQVLSGLDGSIIRKLRHEPHYWLRDKQLVPFKEDHDTYLLNAGRGFGKNFAGAHWMIEQARRRPGANMAVVGETAADVRDYCVEGPSGLLNVGPPAHRPQYEPSKRRLTFPSGAVATTYSADKPDQLRGFSGEVVWWDEAAKSRFAAEVKEQIGYTLREGEKPKLLVTTTPRPIPTIQEMIKDDSVRVVTGSSFENRANLADRFIRKLEKKEDSRLGKQEVHAQLLDEAPGALWSHDTIRHVRRDDVPDLTRIVIAVDPSASEDGDEAGIVVVGLGANGNAYVLEDLSGQLSPSGWAKIAVAAYHGDLSRLSGEDDVPAGVASRPYPWPAASTIVAEKNQGGAMVETTIRSVDSKAAYEPVHAKRGKELRAQPVASAYQEDVFHVGTLSKLEDQMTTWQPGDSDSPDRLDALVYGVTDALDLNDERGRTSVSSASY
jgi:phage terminase large subunit-like protein